MNAVDLLKRLHQHRAWVNGNLLTAAASLSDDLREKWAALEQRWVRYLAALTPESLDDLVHKKVSVTGQRFGTRRGDVLLHVCTHAHYTAAQVVNMLRQAGADKLPETMMISLARHEAT